LDKTLSSGKLSTVPLKSKLIDTTRSSGFNSWVLKHLSFENQGFGSNKPLDNDLSIGEHYPTSEQLGLEEQKQYYK